MFEKYSKEIKKYDFHLRLDNLFKIILWVVLIVSAIIISLPFNNLLLKIILIFAIEIIIICVSVSIYTFWNINKKEKLKKEKNIKNKFKLFFELEENNRKFFIIKLLKENNVNSQDKLLHLIDIYKNKNMKLNINEQQGAFGLGLIFLGLVADYYDSNLKGIDYEKLGYGISFALLSLGIYIILKFTKKIFLDIMFSSKEDINKKFINLLTYFYLHFEEYEKDLKN